MQQYFKVFRELKEKKTLIYLIIIDYLRYYRDLNQIRDYVIDHHDNYVFKRSKASDGKGLRNYLDKMVEADVLLVRKSGKKNEWKVNKDFFMDLKQSAMNLKGDELKYLKSYNEIFKKYQHLLPYPASISKMIQSLEEVDSNKNIGNDYAPISLDLNDDFSGSEHFTTLLEVIEDRNPVDFDFERFPRGEDRESKTSRITSFLPYLLKEHNGRWYLVGKASTSNNENFKVYPLDRISNIDIHDTTFEREALDERTLWKNSMGIYTAWNDENGNWNKKLVDISFKLKNGRRYHNVNYLISNPLHSSQKSTHRYDKEGYVKFSYKMFPDADLVRAIRALGAHHIKDIKPQYLDRWVREE